jgi:hypothetical protein
MDPGKEPLAAVDDDEDDALTESDSVVEYEIIDPVPVMGQHDPLEEYFLMQ